MNHFLRRVKIEVSNPFRTNPFTDNTNVSFPAAKVALSTLGAFPPSSLPSSVAVRVRFHTVASGWRDPAVAERGSGLRFSSRILDDGLWRGCCCLAWLVEAAAGGGPFLVLEEALLAIQPV